MAADDGFPTATAEAVPNAFPGTRSGEAVEFGWEESRKVTGRRKKAEAKKKGKPGSFESMGLSVAIMRGIKRKGYQLPTPIQRKAMPPILAGADVVGMARTGSGKTAAFVLPMLHKLGAHAQRVGARAVILAPTRELALQTARVVRDLGKHLDLRIATLVGGDSMETQFAELAANPDVIIATPGRLAHHMTEIKGFSLKTVEYLVFDEADRLFEMGFAEQLKSIMGGMSEARQTLLFSATMPRALAEFARAGLQEPTLIRLDTDAKISPELGLAFFTVREEDKLGALLTLIKEVIPGGQPTLVFASTRHHVDLLAQLLAAEGIAATYVYGTLDQAARKINIAKFRAGKAQFLVVTDVAARGIDIPLLDNVINFDFPPQPKLFVHRVGRAARAGRVGTAYSLFTKEELPYVLDLHLFLARKLQPAPRQSIGAAAAASDAEAPENTSFFGSFPLVTLESAGEHAREVIASSADLQSAVRSASKALALYRKTRPGPSLESIKRSRDFAQQGIHPLLAASLPATALGGLEAQEGLAAISAALRSYRPAQTVLEARVAGARSSHIRFKGRKRQPVAPGDPAASLSSRQPAEEAVLASEANGLEANGATPSDDNLSDAAGSSDEDMSAGWGADDDDVGSRKPRRGGSRKQKMLVLPEEPAPSGRFKQSGFYIPHIREGQQDEAGYSLSGPDGGNAMDAAVLDIVGEDAEGIKTQDRAYHWDKRQKKYVQLQPDETVRAGKRKRVESGVAAKVKDGKESSGIYEKWAKQQKRRIPAAGTEAKRDTYDPNLADRFKKGGRGWVNPLKAGKSGGKSAGAARQELKSAQQVAKERKVAERKKERQKGGSNKGVKDKDQDRPGKRGLGVKGGVSKPGSKLPKGAAPMRKYGGDKTHGRGKNKGGGGKKGGGGGKGGRRR